MSSHILVVDDDSDILEAMSLVFGGAGYRVRTAMDGAAALECLRREALPCLILLDLMMPNMDGWQLVNEVKRESLWANVPIVVLSGGVRDDDLVSLGVAGCLRKPVEVATLFATVQKYC